MTTATFGLNKDDTPVCRLIDAVDVRLRSDCTWSSYVFVSRMIKAIVKCHVFFFLYAKGAISRLINMFVYANANADIANFFFYLQLFESICTICVVVVALLLNIDVLNICI